MPSDFGITPQGDDPNPAAQAQLQMLSRGERLFLWSIFWLGLTLSVSAIIVAAIRWNFALSRFGPAVVWHWSMTAILTAAISFLIAIAALAIWAIRRNHTAYAHAAGLTLQLGQRRRHYPWESLRDLKLSVVRYGPAWGQWGIRTSAMLITNRNKRLRFRGSMAELDIFTNTIKRYLYPLRLRAYRQALESQQTIRFGPLQCSPEGLLYRRQRFPWDTVTSANLEAGRLTLSIQKTGKTKKIRIAAGRLPNPDLCAQLIENVEY